MPFHRNMRMQMCEVRRLCVSQNDPFVLGGKVRTTRHFHNAFVAFALLATTTIASAQWVIGRYAGEFLALGAGARALAMGDASVAVPAASTAGYYNPSALATLDKRSVEFMHSSQFDNLYTYDYLSFARPMAGGYGGGLTVLYTRVGDIPRTVLADPTRPLDDNNRVLVANTFGDHELAIMASAGRRASAWRVGGNAKLLYKTVAGRSAYGLGFDVAAGRTLGKHIEAGAIIRDLTTSVLAWSTGRTESIIPSFVVGGAWTTTLPSLSARVTVAADAEGHFESRGSAEQVDAGPLSLQPHIGLEYLIADVVALRGGVSGSELTAGAGLRLAWLNVGAAFQKNADLGLIQRVSVGALW
jgi:hypothetical protein